MSKKEARKPSSSSLQDQALVQEALNGNQRSFEKLLNKYREPLSHHIFKMVREEKMVEDLVQEAFIKAFNSLASYSTSFAFSTWLYKIATNHTIDYLRKRKLPTTSINQTFNVKDGEMEIELPDSTYRPDQHIIRDEKHVIINEAIDSLPEKYKRVIVMRHQQEKSYEEIARELDIPLGTVKAHIFRAREILYRHLVVKRESL